MVKAKDRSDKDDLDDDDGEEEKQSHSDLEIIDGVEIATKMNKATILRKATEYILFLKRSNELLNQENQILQNILSQLPGGQQVLAQFLVQKEAYQKQEQERLARERKEAQRREQEERRQMLRERAAQRAALAQLMPKRERRPYRRRKGTTQQHQSRSPSVSQEKTYIAMFLCLAFFSTSSSFMITPISHAHRPSTTLFNDEVSMTSSLTFNYWYAYPGVPSVVE